MKLLKRILSGTIILIALLIISLYVFGYDYLLKAVMTVYAQGHTTAYLEDYKAFDNRLIEVGEPQPWAIHKNYNTATTSQELEDWNTKYGTVAYLIIKNDSIWFEKYYEDFDKNSRSNSFSMAKSVVTTLLGKAIMDGYIKGLDQPVGDFYPEFSQGLAAQMTVGDLSSMASGTNWDEAYYSPFSITTRAYFDNHLKDIILGLKVVEQPGQAFKYASGDTQLLAMVLEKATGKSLSDYMSTNFWKPMGAENPAFWQLDSEDGGLEKAYCCIASNARDFARFGKLYKDHGKWNNQQLLDSAFIKTAITPRFEASPQYGYGWWLMQDYHGKDFFMMRGHLGQYVIVQPEDNLIIVRLGHQTSKREPGDIFTKDIFTYIDEAYNMLTP
ncbi:serine hydrolase domain-containing protein [Mangrovimonas aestuarii]|uniref:serine hydrolase domain-containing protein n=1 Tax=Mangrovimonas aestuarii TaxID=3018443 RepID=UPI0023783F5E|nr:serine hydrolase [Mangrovimonas aestuarii]